VFVATHVEREMSAEDRALYEAYYNRSLSSSLDRDLDLQLVLNVTNQTTTPPITLKPLNLSAIMINMAPVIDILHEPFQHSICSPTTCLGCPRQLPTDRMTTITTS